MTTDPRLAPLSEALDSEWPSIHAFDDGGVWMNYAKRLLAALPPDWCGHDLRAIRNRAWQDGVNAANVDPDLAHLRRVEVLARAASKADAVLLKATEEGDDDDVDEASAEYAEAMDALSAALGSDR